MDKIIVGSRESRLAVAQSMTVIRHIQDHFPQKTVLLETMKTTGDRILDRTLDRVGGKGLFVKELDLALRNRKADITVHSLKDMPVEIPDDLPLIAFSKREDPRDVLVLPEGKKEPDKELPIGSSSLRRVLQLKELYPGYEIKSVRGNLQTRLRKLDEGEYGALVLAAAGLIRLGLESRISRYFSVEEIIPAAGQGIIAVQGRAHEDHSYLEEYNDASSKAIALCERAYIRELDGGCTSPVCAHAQVEGSRIYLSALYYDEKTGNTVRGKAEGKVSEAEGTGTRLACILREKSLKDNEQK